MLVLGCHQLDLVEALTQSHPKSNLDLNPLVLISFPKPHPTQAADFLQKHGKTRTGSERKAELSDVDINSDGIISFLEYLLLHYKVRLQRQKIDYPERWAGRCVVNWHSMDPHNRTTAQPHNPAQPRTTYTTRRM